MSFEKLEHDIKELARAGMLEAQGHILVAQDVIALKAELAIIHEHLRVAGLCDCATKQDKARNAWRN